MIMYSDTLAIRIQEHINNCYQRIPLVNAMLSGSLPKNVLRRHAKRHHAEIRTFIDFKLPERMRLCPTEAIAAKKYFSELYIAEQGNFIPGQNHADMFKPVCYKLSISDNELVEEYQSYWPRYRSMLVEYPSYEILVRELSISCAWESLLASLGGSLIASLRTTYGFTDKDLIYFCSHSEVDKQHSDNACKILQSYITDEHLEQLSLTAITDTLLEKSYFDF